MSLDARLNKVMPVLTARERGILVLKSLKDKTPESPALRRTMPPEQMSEFNRLIVLMNACNVYLPLFITMVELNTEQMEVRMSWLMTLTQYGSALWNLGKLVPASKRMQADEAMADFFPHIELPWDGEDHERSWLNVADGMQETIRQCVAHLWDDVMAIDTVLAEVTAQFDGEDPMRPFMRSILEKARYKLSILHEVLSGRRLSKLPSPRKRDWSWLESTSTRALSLWTASDLVTR